MALVALVFLPLGNASLAGANSQSIKSSLSVYLNCPGSILFAEPGASGSCGSGNYTSVYSGISQTIVSNMSAVFFLASATGGVKVTFSLTDVTTGKLLLNGVAYGSMSGGTCGSPAIILPASSIASMNVLNSGDKVNASLDTIFTGTGTPTFCSGGDSATFISVGTTVITGTAQPALTTLLNAGSPYQTTLSGFNGVAESYIDTGSLGLTAVVVGVVKSSSGSIIDVLVTSVSVSPGENATAFLKFNQYQSGTYTVSITAITGSYVPVSVTEQASASV